MKANIIRFGVSVVVCWPVWWLQMLAWNYVAPDLGLPQLGYWKIVCLDIFLSMVYPAAARWATPHQVKVVEE